MTFQLGALGAPQDDFFLDSNFLGGFNFLSIASVCHKKRCVWIYKAPRRLMPSPRNPSTQGEVGRLCMNVNVSFVVMSRT